MSQGSTSPPAPVCPPYDFDVPGVNPGVYLVDVIDKIAADGPADRVTALLPRAWLAARQAEQQRPGQAGAVAVT